MRKLFSVLIALLMLTGVALAEEPETYTWYAWEYILTDTGAVITNWYYGDVLVDRPAVVEIPAELDGQPLVGIGYNALNTYEMDSEISFTLIIPEGVKWLSDDVFWCCHNATAVFFPSTLEIIPEGVEEIGEAVLYDWYYHSIQLPESLKKIEYMGLCCMVGSPVTIPAGCTDIGDDALPMLEDEPWY